MNKHINYQMIEQNGRPAFVVIPYEEFITLYPRAKVEIEKKYIPHAVVKNMVIQDISLIKSWREYLGLTQQEVATKMGITQAALSQIEAGDSKPRTATLKKLAEIFGISIEQLR